jgi:hypothetical protein
MIGWILGVAGYSIDFGSSPEYGNQQASGWAFVVFGVFWFVIVVIYI